VIPSTFLFVTHDTHSNLSQLSLSDPDSCPAFHRWRLLREFWIPVDFHRIVRSDFGLLRLQNFGPDRAEFEESLVIDRSDRASIRIYRRRMNGDLSVVKSISVSPLIESCQIETEIENLFNVRHPLIGSVFPVGEM
jgi:hypothetical protein